MLSSSCYSKLGDWLRGNLALVIPVGIFLLLSSGISLYWWSASKSAQGSNSDAKGEPTAPLSWDPTYFKADNDAADRSNRFLFEHVSREIQDDLRKDRDGNSSYVYVRPNPDE